jgi:molybdopterin adenylyltransferase
LGKVTSANTALSKGEKKSPVDAIVLVPGKGVQGDAHFSDLRQVSLLAQESVDRRRPAGFELEAGDFGENLTVEGIDLLALGVGARLTVGSEAILQISEIGKTCNEPCSIGKRLGQCVMPTEGVFAKVMRGGTVRPGDSIEPANIKAGAVLTSSDRCSRGERQDESGPLLVDLLTGMGITVVDYTILPDDQVGLTDKLFFLADRCAVDVILTTGGTGLSPRDRMPEAATLVIDSSVPGIAEALRQGGMKHTPFACLSRGSSGLRGRTLIINLPGSARAIEESSDLLKAILPHAIEVLRAQVTDCGRTTG